MEVKTERQPHGRRNGSAKRLLIGGIPLPLGPGARPDAFAIYEAETATRLTRAGGRTTPPISDVQNRDREPFGFPYATRHFYFRQTLFGGVPKWGMKYSENDRKP